MSEEEKEEIKEKSRRDVIVEALEAAGESFEENESFEEPGVDAEESPEVPEAEENEDELSVDGEEASKEVSPEIQGVLPPPELSEEEKKEFEELAKVAPKVAAKAAKRFYEQRRDYTQKTMELARQRQAYEGLERTVDKHTNRLARKGISVEQAISNALAWDHFIEEQGINGIVQFVEKYGYDVQELAEAVDSGEAYSGRIQQGAIPRELQDRLDRLERFEQQYQQSQLQQSRAQQSQYVENTLTALNQFKSSKPIFKDPSTAEQVEAAMAPLVETFRKKEPGKPVGEILERAYAYVMKGDPRFASLSNGMEAKQKIEAERDRSNRALAASSVRGSGPGSGSPSHVPKGRRPQIAAALDGRLTI